MVSNFEETLHTTSETEIAGRKIEAVLNMHEATLGKFHIVPVGEVGFLLQSEKNPPQAAVDWVMIDYDDTLVGTTKVKKDRLDAFSTFLTKSRLELSPEMISEIMSFTDKFARWETHQGEGDHYQPQAHIQALEYIVSELLKLNSVNPVSKTENRNYNSTLGLTWEAIKMQLSRIKGQLKSQGDNPSLEDDPFYFQNHKLVLRTVTNLPNPKLREVFERTIFDPPRNREMIEACKSVANNGSPIINMGVFTYGDPVYQLQKVLGLMESEGLQFSQIWLTRTAKGEFISRVALQSSDLGSKGDLPITGATRLEDTGEETNRTGSNSEIILGKSPHTILMFDDDPKQLTSIADSNKMLENIGSGARFVVVRVKFEGSKAQNKKWEMTEFHQGVPLTLDFTTKSSLSADSIVGLINTERYLRMVANLGAMHPNSLQLAQMLRAQGIVVVDSLETEVEG